jgi:hypothetical protein
VGERERKWGRQRVKDAKSQTEKKSERQKDGH